MSNWRTPADIWGQSPLRQAGCCTTAKTNEFPPPHARSPGSGDGILPNRTGTPEEGGVGQKRLCAAREGLAKIAARYGTPTADLAGGGDAFGDDAAMKKDWGFSALVEVAGKRPGVAISVQV